MAGYRDVKTIHKKSNPLNNLQAPGTMARKIPSQKNPTPKHKLSKTRDSFDPQEHIDSMTLYAYSDLVVRDVDGIPGSHENTRQDNT
jgi:hypothetical protein